MNFKLRPVPFETRTILAVGKCEDLLGQAQRIIASRLFPVTAELLSPTLAQTIELSDGVEHLLMLKFAGSSSAVTDQTSSTMEMLAGNNGHLAARIVSDDKIIWRSLAALPLRNAQALVWRVGLRPVDLGSFLKAMDRTGADSKSIWQAGIGDGRVRVIDHLQQNQSEVRESGDETLGRLEALQEQVQSLGGTLIIEHAPAEIRARCNAWGTSNSFADLMQRVKQQLDPEGIFSPGRF